MVPAVETILNRVEALDLDPIVHRLVDRYGWEMDRARDVERQYRQFLVEAADRRVTEPTPDVDEFWHQHILDTQTYYRDCFAVFGELLHHQPTGPSSFWGCIIPPRPTSPEHAPEARVPSVV